MEKVLSAERSLYRAPLSGTVGTLWMIARPAPDTPTHEALNAVYHYGKEYLELCELDRVGSFFKNEGHVETGR